MPIKTFEKHFQDMREWLIDCYPDEELEIKEASNEYILKIIKDEYEGGVAQFIADSEPVSANWFHHV